MEHFQLISEMITYLEDQGFTPHVALQTKVVGTCGIPESVIQPCGHVTLNVSMKATNNSLHIGMYQCGADMSFNGQHYSVAWHPDAVVAVYSPDGGPKLVFPKPDLDSKPDTGRPKLHLVGKDPLDGAGFRKHLAESRDEEL